MLGYTSVSLIQIGSRSSQVIGKKKKKKKNSPKAVMVTVIIILAFSFFPTFLVLLHEEHIDESWSTISSLLKYYIHYKFINPFHATGLFLYPLKTWENLKFSYNFRGNRKISLPWNGFLRLRWLWLLVWKNLNLTLWNFIVVLIYYPISAQFCVSYRNQYLFCRAKQMTGFSTKRNTGLKWVKSTFSYRVNTWFRLMLYI